METGTERPRDHDHGHDTARPLAPIEQVAASRVLRTRLVDEHRLDGIVAPSDDSALKVRGRRSRVGRNQYRAGCWRRTRRSPSWGYPVPRASTWWSSQHRTSQQLVGCPSGPAILAHLACSRSEYKAPATTGRGEPGRLAEMESRSTTTRDPSGDSAPRCATSCSRSDPGTRPRGTGARPERHSRRVRGVQRRDPRRD